LGDSFRAYLYIPISVEEEFVLYSPECAFLFFAFFCFIFCLFNNFQLNYFYKVTDLLTSVFISYFFCEIYFFSVLTHPLLYTHMGIHLILQNFLLISQYTVALKMLILAIAGLMIPLFYSFFLTERRFVNEIVFLFNILVFSCLTIVTTVNFIVLYFLLELINFVFCIFLGCYGTSTKQILDPEVILRYFIFNILTSLFILYGIALIYYTLGDLEFFFSDLHLLFNNTDSSRWFILLFGYFLVLFGLLTKIGLFPLSLWVVDIYESTPFFYLTIFVALIKFSYIFTLFNFYYQIFFLAPVVPAYLYVTSLLSIFFGTFILLVQNNLKRILGYSSIVQLSYTILAFSYVSLNGVIFGFLHLFIYILTSYLFFSILHSFVILCKLNNIGFNRLLLLSDLANLAHKFPFYGIILIAGLLSLSALPPFAGFFTKYYIYTEILNQHDLKTFFLLGCLGIISTFNYLRILRIMVYSPISVVHANSFKFNHFRVDYYGHHLVLIAIVFFLTFYIFFDSFMVAFFEYLFYGHYF
jgi:NADH-quinone oxidoreductase subunit N